MRPQLANSRWAHFLNIALPRFSPCGPLPPPARKNAQSLPRRGGTCLTRRTCARIHRWLIVTYPLSNAPKPNPKQPVVDPKESHSSPTVDNRTQYVQSQGLAHHPSNTGEHMSVTHRCAVALLRSLPVPSQNKGYVLSCDLEPGDPRTSRLTAKQYLGNAKWNTPHTDNPIRNVCRWLHHVVLLFVLLSGAMSEENVMVCSMVNADSVNVEAPNSAVIHSRLQRILARHYVAHREQSCIQPNMFKTFQERVFPAELQLNPHKHTLLYPSLQNIQHKN